MEFTYVKVEVLLPEEHIESLRNRLNDLGVLTVGNYDHVVSYSHVKGYWRPLDNAQPYNGRTGEISFGSECKLEFKCSYKEIDQVKQAIKNIHPYEEPVIYVLPLLD